MIFFAGIKVLIYKIKKSITIARIIELIDMVIKLLIGNSKKTGSPANKDLYKVIVKPTKVPFIKNNYSYQLKIPLNNLKI
jgi:hypothetical protein